MDMIKGSPVGIIERAIALIIDVIITIIFAVIITFIFDFPVLTTAVIFSSFYGVFLPFFWNGYTIGKRIIGIRIADIDGKNLTFTTMLTRSFLADLLYTATFGILSIVSIYLVSNRNDKRSIHDLLAKTYVTANPSN